MNLTLSKKNKFNALLKRARYKIFYGGRGGAKSWAFARTLLKLADNYKLRILCAREFQASIADSVHKLLSDQISLLGLSDRFKVTEKAIVNIFTGSEFLFKGLHHNVAEIKSLEGIDICWIEEAQTISKASLEILIPTIRKLGSEIWMSFNPKNDTDPVYQFVKNPPKNSIIVKVGWQDNPYFPKELNDERLYMLQTDIDAYNHIWEGECLTIGEAVIFRNRVVIEAFETPQDARFYHGADWGFAADPTALVRSFIVGNDLFIDREAFGYGVELDELPQLFDSIETSRKWPIKADNARPETISKMASSGFNIKGADKWPGSVEDGIAHLKGFKRIVIHQSCKHMQDEARLYSYKTDKQTGDILPIIVDKHNHGWDAVRYSLDGYIQGKGRPMKINPALLNRTR